MISEGASTATMASMLTFDGKASRSKVTNYNPFYVRCEFNGSANYGRRVQGGLFRPSFFGVRRLRSRAAGHSGRREVSGTLEELYPVCSHLAGQMSRVGAVLYSRDFFYHAVPGGRLYHDRPLVFWY